MKFVIVIALIVLVSMLNFIRRDDVRRAFSRDDENSILVSNSAAAYGDNTGYAIPITVCWHPEGDVSIDCENSLIADVGFDKEKSELLVRPIKPGKTKVTLTNSLDKESHTFTLNIV